AMGQDVARHPRHALGYMFGPPGWSHDASRDTSATLRAQWEAGQGEPEPEPTQNLPDRQAASA
ncbi:MAG: sterol desaturase family protein, partial [Phenylobacterium sp.]|nr:sterol desaturase family protein [Phenylobacterium sp.]